MTLSTTCNYFDVLRASHFPLKTFENIVHLLRCFVFPFHFSWSRMSSVTLLPFSITSLGMIFTTASTWKGKSILWFKRTIPIRIITLATIPWVVMSIIIFILRLTSRAVYKGILWALWSTQVDQLGGHKRLILSAQENQQISPFNGPFPLSWCTPKSNIYALNNHYHIEEHTSLNIYFL